MSCRHGNCLFRILIRTNRPGQIKGAGLNVGVLIVDFWKVDSLATSISERRGQTQPCGGLFDPFERSVWAAFLSGFADGRKFLLRQRLVDPMDPIG